MFQDNASVPSSRVLFFSDFLTLEEGTNMLSRNVGKRLSFDTAKYPRRAQI
jgi:hypothetical protein